MPESRENKAEAPAIRLARSDINNQLPPNQCAIMWRTYTRQHVVMMTNRRFESIESLTRTIHLKTAVCADCLTDAATARNKAGRTALPL